MGFVKQGQGQFANARLLCSRGPVLAVATCAPA
jgi:hypothetical protein